MLKHLVRVEVSWFQHRLAQIPTEDLPILEWIDEEEGDFLLGPDDTVDRLTALDEERYAGSRKVAARFVLDHVASHPYLDRVTMRPKALIQAKTQTGSESRLGRVSRGHRPPDRCLVDASVR